MDNAAKVEVFDASGRVVFSKQGNDEWIETNLSAGMYVVKIVASSGKTTFEKIIIN